MLTARRLQELLSYDPGTGLFTWKVTFSRAKLGKVAGSFDSDGYHKIQIDGRVYRGHRLAWLYMTGEWPESEIDHRDLDRSNNRWDNLRPATHSQNQMNTRPRGVSGIKGVRWHGRDRVFRATIWLNGRAVQLGAFATAEAAAAAYAVAARQHFGEFARF